MIFCRRALTLSVSRRSSSLSWRAGFTEIASELENDPERSLGVVGVKQCSSSLLVVRLSLRILSRTRALASFLFDTLPGSFFVVCDLSFFLDFFDFFPCFFLFFVGEEEGLAEEVLGESEAVASLLDAFITSEVKASSSDRLEERVRELLVLCLPGASR